MNEEDNTLKILTAMGETVQSATGGTVAGVSVHPVTGDVSVVIEGPEGWYCEYGHLEYRQMEDPQVEIGSKIRRGNALGFAKEDEEGRRWVSFRLLKGEDWRTATAVDPWSVEYRTYDFLPVTRDTVTVAGDLKISRALQTVLRGEAAFYNVETEEYCCTDALPFSDDLPVTVCRYAWLDMDSDAIPEVVLWLDRGGDEYMMGSMVLHYQNGWVYGYPMGFRSMNLLTLKADGSYNWSGGADNNGWGRMNFQTGETENVTWINGESYYVDGQLTTREAFYEAYDRWEAKPNAAWQEFSEADLGR